MNTRSILPVFLTTAILAATASAPAQQARPKPGTGPAAPEIISPDVAADRKVTFRIQAPQAKSVRLTGGDIPNVGRGVELKQTDNAVWEVSMGPIDPGAYRYVFNVDGISVVDPENPSISQSNNNVWSLVYIPGSDLSDVNNVPHGAVAEVTYYSQSLKRVRRMHVYTPPGYESGGGKFPVFYLLHGASDSDDSWTSVGRAGFILDNLIAAGKAKPMIVVMPAGHTTRFRSGPRSGGSAERQVDEFAEDFVNDLKPFVEKNYRVYTDRAHRAMAGLSMGGAQTLNIGIPHLEEYAYLGVYSSGVFGIAGDGRSKSPGPPWEERHQKVLDNAELKKGLKLIWFATGKEDFLLETSKRTVSMLKKHGFDVVYRETAGGHTWINWRDYLGEFVPLLFSEGESSPPSAAK